MKKAFQNNTVLWILILGLFSFVSGCSLTKSDEEKAEDFFQSGMAFMESQQYKTAVLEFKNAVQKNPELAKAYFQLGLAYIAQREVLLGFIEMRTAVRLDPENDSFLNTYTDLLLEYHYYKDAAKYLKTILKRSPNDTALQLKLGNAQLKANRFDQAAETFGQVIEKQPDSVKAKIGLAAVLVSQNKFYGAEKLLKENVSVAPNSAEARIALARFFEKRRRFDQAGSIFAQVSHDFPDDPEAQIAYAQYLIRRKKLQAARQVANMAAKRGLEAPTLLHIEAYLEDKDGKTQAALKTLKKAIQLFPDDPKSWIFLGDQHIRMKQYAKARQAYRQALSKGAEKSDQMLDVAFTYYREGEYGKATSEVKKVLEEYPNSSRAHYLYGRLLREQGKRDSAKEAFRLSKAYDSENSGAHYYYGLSLFEEGEYERAKMAVSTALSLQPSSTRAQMLLARIHFRLNNNEKALKMVNRVLEARPNDVEARRLRGEAYARMKRYSAAARDYSFVTSHDSKDPNTLFRLAEIYQAQGQTEKALAAYDRISSTYPDKSRLLRRITQIYMEMDNCKEAIDTCRKYRADNPEILKIGLVNSQVLVKCGEKKQARKLLEHLAKVHPSSTRPYLMLGDLSLDGAKDMKVAIGYFEKAAERDPHSASAYLGLADAYEQMGQANLAERSYQKAIEIEPDSVVALNNLAFLYARSDGNLDKALPLAARAEKLAPKDPDVLDTLGLIHLKKGAFLLAQKNFLDALKQDSENGSVNYHLGVYKYLHNDFEAAKKYFEQAIKFGVDGLTSKQILSYEDHIKRTERDMAAASADAAQGELEKAISLYEEILSAIGFYAPAAAKLASIYAESNRELDRALELAEKAKKMLPADPHLLDTLGLIYLKKGSFLIAKRYFNEAISVSPETALFHYHLGLLYFREHKNEMATHALRHSIKLGLSGKSLESARRMLKELKDSHSTPEA